MRKIIVMLSLAMLFVGCKKGPKEEPKPEPFPIGTWHTTHQFFNLTVADAHPGFVKEKLEQETSVEIPEAKSYRLMFNEDGTGIGSGSLPNASGWYDFEFTWLLSEDELTITKAESESDGVFYLNRLVFNGLVFIDTGEVEDIVWKEQSDAIAKVDWMVEESSADKMVLSWSMSTQTRITDIWVEWRETLTYRYTFKKQ